MTQTSATPRVVGRAQWMTLTAALLGWMFDGAEMGIFSLVGRPAMKDLLSRGGEVAEESLVQLWFGVVMATFLIGAATGGVVFGWLGDRVGRVRAMTLSVFTYAFFTGACGLVTEPWHLVVLRFVAALGMGGEWSLGVALVMEVWPNRSRAFMAGLIGAAANVGYLFVPVASLLVLSSLEAIRGAATSLGLGEDAAAALVAYDGWRTMMILGTAPALLTFFIRLFVPESERWAEGRRRGTTSHWATRDLLAVLVGAAGPVGIVALWANDIPFDWQVVGTVVGLGVAIAGYTFPVMRFLQREAETNRRPATEWRGTLGHMLVAACLSGVALLGTWGLTQWIPNWANQMTSGVLVDGQPIRAKEYTQFWTSLGAVLGTLGAALLGDWLGRRPAYIVQCALSMVSVWLLVLATDGYGGGFLAGAFLVGICTASFYGWLPLYLPELFRTPVRATGQGFGFNFGRILAAVGVLQMASLIANLSDDTVLLGLTVRGGFPLACMAMSLIYVVGLAIIWLAPETKGRPLPE